jgi:3-deoxy-7-phosphoheptulonate synthase
MFIVLERKTQKSHLDEIFAFLQKQKINYRLIHARERIVIDISHNEEEADREQLLSLEGVEKVFYITEPYKLVSRNFMEENTVIDLDLVRIGSEDPTVIAGPCSVESEEQIMEAAWLVKAHGVQILRGGAFKPRTSPYSFQGLREKGLEILAKAREETGLYIITEVVDTMDIPVVAQYADILQIGSRNMLNYELLKAVGRINKPILLKRAMSATMKEFLLSAEYLMSEGNTQVILCERGIRTFDDFSRNTLDLAIIPAIQKITHLPVIVDPSHATGRSDLIEPMSMAALAAGAQGLMIEIHPNPPKSFSDANQALNPQQFANLMHKINHYLEWQKAYANTPHAY